MPTPFPGMDPYLERPALWKQVHTSLIVDIQRALAHRLRPKYQVAIEQRTYLAVSESRDPVGDPDVLVMVPPGGRLAGPALSGVAVAGPSAYTVDVPMPEEIVERYLEVRDVVTGTAITVIEILSPANKMSERDRYEAERLKIFGNMTNLVEIDLLRAGRAMSMEGNIPDTHYRILISRSRDRPRGQALLFNVCDVIPDVPIPLRYGEEEPLLPLNQILHDLYDQAGYDLFIDYQQKPSPRLSEEYEAWSRRVIAESL